MYGDKVVAFFDRLLDAQYAGKPFMRHYLDYYFDIYWDLHVGVKGDAIPQKVRQIGESFNTVLAYRDPTQQIVYRELHDGARAASVSQDVDRRAGRRRRQWAGCNPEKTFA